MEPAMTTQEIELLSDLYMQDGDRIREGKLFSHQEEALRQLRAGMEYMNQKYPGALFTVTAFQSATQFHQSGELSLEEGGITYTAYVEVKDQDYSFSDNYYSKYLQPRYDQYLESVLSSGGWTGRSFTRFPSASETLGPDTTAEELLRTAPKQTRTVDLFVITQDQEKTAREVQDLIVQAGLYGTYTLYFVPELDDIQTMEELRPHLEHVSFNCFDL